MSWSSRIESTSLYDTLFGGDGSSEQLAIVLIFPRLDVFHISVLVIFCNLLLLASCFFFCGATRANRRNVHISCSTTPCNDPKIEVGERRAFPQCRPSRNCPFREMDTIESLSIPFIASRSYVQCNDEPRLRERKPTMMAVQIVWMQESIIKGRSQRENLYILYWFWWDSLDYMVNGLKSPKSFTVTTNMLRIEIYYRIFYFGFHAFFRC